MKSLQGELVGGMTMDVTDQGIDYEFFIFNQGFFFITKLIFPINYFFLVTFV